METETLYYALTVIENSPGGSCSILRAALPAFRYHTAALRVESEHRVSRTNNEQSDTFYQYKIKRVGLCIK